MAHLMHSILHSNTIIQNQISNLMGDIEEMKRRCSNIEKENDIVKENINKLLLWINNGLIVKNEVYKHPGDIVKPVTNDVHSSAFEEKLFKQVSIQFEKDYREAQEENYLNQKRPKFEKGEENNQDRKRPRLFSPHREKHTTNDNYRKSQYRSKFNNDRRSGSNDKRDYRSDSRRSGSKDHIKYKDRYNRSNYRHRDNITEFRPKSPDMKPISEIKHLQSQREYFLKENKLEKIDNKSKPNFIENNHMNRESEQNKKFDSDCRAKRPPNPKQYYDKDENLIIDYSDQTVDMKCDAFDDNKKIDEINVCIKTSKDKKLKDDHLHVNSDAQFKSKKEVNNDAINKNVKIKAIDKRDSEVGKKRCSISNENELDKIINAECMNKVSSCDLKYDKESNKKITSIDKVNSNQIVTQNNVLNDKSLHKKVHDIKFIDNKKELKVQNIDETSIKNVDKTQNMLYNLFGEDDEDIINKFENEQTKQNDLNVNINEITTKHEINSIKDEEKHHAIDKISSESHAMKVLTQVSLSHPELKNYKIKKINKQLPIDDVQSDGSVDAIVKDVSKNNNLQDVVRVEKVVQDINDKVDIKNRVFGDNQNDDNIDVELNISKTLIKKVNQPNNVVTKESEALKPIASNNVVSFTVSRKRRKIIKQNTNLDKSNA